MDKSNKRGKIPQTDWPLIMARYEAGETLASIARTYDCSPPAISYIVSRNRDKPANETPPAPAPEPQLIKSRAANGSVVSPEPEVAPVTDALAEVRVDALALQSEGSERPVATAASSQPIAAPQRTTAPGANGEHRPKLHLGFGNGNGNGNGNNHTNGVLLSPQGQRPQQPPPRLNSLGDGHGNPGSPPMRDARPSVTMPAPQMPRDEAPARKDGGTALDQELRSRIDSDVTAFLAAFDAVLEADTQESRFGLKEATDRLLRVGARTRIELERLEARTPLAAREGSGRSEPAGWRYR